MLLRKQAQLSLPPKNAGGTRLHVETNIRKNSKAIIMLALCPGRCLLHHKGIANDQITSPRRSGKREVCSESVTKFSFNFLYETRLYRGKASLEILYNKTKKKLFETAQHRSIKKHLISC